MSASNLQKHVDIAVLEGQLITCSEVIPGCEQSTVQVCIPATPCASQRVIYRSNTGETGWSALGD